MLASAQRNPFLDPNTGHGDEDDDDAHRHDHTVVRLTVQVGNRSKTRDEKNQTDDDTGRRAAAAGLRVYTNNDNNIKRIIAHVYYV